MSKSRHSNKCKALKKLENLVMISTSSKYQSLLTTIDPKVISTLEIRQLKYKPDGIEPLKLC